MFGGIETVQRWDEVARAQDDAGPQVAYDCGASGDGKWWYLRIRGLMNPMFNDPNPAGNPAKERDTLSHGYRIGSSLVTPLVSNSSRTADRFDRSIDRTDALVSFAWGLPTRTSSRAPKIDAFENEPEL